MQIRKALSPEKIKTPIAVVESENKEDEDEDEDERVLNEIEERTNIVERRQKKEKKLQAKRRAKVYAYAPPSLFQFLFWFAVVYTNLRMYAIRQHVGVIILLSFEELIERRSDPNREIPCFSLIKASGFHAFPLFEKAYGGSSIF